jgi:hypothetical protein
MQYQELKPIKRKTLKYGLVLPIMMYSLKTFDRTYLASYLLVSFIEQPNSYWNQRQPKNSGFKNVIFPLFTYFLIRQSLKHALNLICISISLLMENQNLL